MPPHTIVNGKVIVQSRIDVQCVQINIDEMSDGWKWSGIVPLGYYQLDSPFDGLISNLKAKRVDDWDALTCSKSQLEMFGTPRSSEVRNVLTKKM